VEHGKKIAEEECALIITDLDNYGFPLIRYENGDAGVPVVEDEIDCEIQFQRIEMISGRVSDIIHFPNGGVLSFLINGLLINVKISLVISLLIPLGIIPLTDLYIDLNIVILFYQ